MYYEYESVRLPYLFEGKTHTYIVDFYIITIDGEEKNIELKPNKYAPCNKTLTKWATAKQELDNFEILEFKEIEDATRY